MQCGVIIISFVEKSETSPRLPLPIQPGRLLLDELFGAVKIFKIKEF
jgi:hypothetical protein